MSLMRSASAINWQKETSFDPLDSTPYYYVEKVEELIAML